MFESPQPLGKWLTAFGVVLGQTVHHSHDELRERPHRAPNFSPFSLSCLHTRTRYAGGCRCPACAMIHSDCRPLDSAQFHLTLPSAYARPPARS